MPEPYEGNDWILILGSGIAGLLSAIRLSPRPCLIVAPEPAGYNTNSFLAQGGIAAALDSSDSANAHAIDTIRAGRGLVDEELASNITDKAAYCIEVLSSLGVAFERDDEGAYGLSREAAHSANRVARINSGDGAGRALMQTLVDVAIKTPSITFLEGWHAVSLHILSDKVAGAWLRPTDTKQENVPLYIPAPATILAAGGCAAIYATTTNPQTQSGEALGMVARAGATIADAEFVQFHPTALNFAHDPALLATEALRGEGAVIIDQQGKRFLQQVSNDAELAPRDQIAQAIYRIHAKGGRTFLDVRKLDRALLTQRFPFFLHNCLEAGFDPEKQPIPVVTAAHYHMGGVATDEHGRTSLPGLWACGEIAATGFHGASRLASNALLETVFFAIKVAEDCYGAEHMPPHKAPDMSSEHKAMLARPPNLALIGKLRRIMDSHAGVVRNGQRLHQLLAQLKKWDEEYGVRSMSVRNRLATATLIAAGALARKESRGAHYRSDYPQLDSSQAQRSKTSLSEAMTIGKEYSDIQTESKNS